MPISSKEVTKTVTSVIFSRCFSCVIFEVRMSMELETQKKDIFSGIVIDCNYFYLVSLEVDKNSLS